MASLSAVGVAGAQTAGTGVVRFADRLVRMSRRRAAGARTVILQALGLASIDYAMFQWTQIAGYVAVGVSFFALEFITGGAPAEAEGGDRG